MSERLLQNLVLRCRKRKVVVDDEEMPPVTRNIGVRKRARKMPVILEEDEVFGPSNIEVKLRQLQLKEEAMEPAPEVPTITVEDTNSNVRVQKQVPKRCDI